MTMPAHAQPCAADLLIRRPGRVDYEACWQGMRAFTAGRTPSTPDELWLLEHPPVYTMGLKGGLKPPAELHGIPLIHTDRGGDITYHGPGQLVAYALIDLRRRGLGIKQLVSVLEQAVIDLVAAHGVAAHRRGGAPGVYVEGRKLASLGLRVKNGASYHGLSLNVDMDLAPFACIDPCGHPGLGVTQLADLGIRLDRAAAGEVFANCLARLLGYNAVNV
jgi:lipoyl(octanoyl) transferase